MADSKWGSRWISTDDFRHNVNAMISICQKICRKLDTSLYNSLRHNVHIIRMHWHENNSKWLLVDEHVATSSSYSSAHDVSTKSANSEPTILLKQTQEFSRPCFMIAVLVLVWTLFGMPGYVCGEHRLTVNKFVELTESLNTIISAVHKNLPTFGIV